VDRSKLREFLRERHYNLSSLCKEYGITYQTFWGWLRGNQKTISQTMQQQIKKMSEELGYKE
jgi:hypothetical protein